MSKSTRRQFLEVSSFAAAGALCNCVMPRAGRGSTAGPQADMAFGLVTYMWGHDWDLPALLANCQKALVHGVELRTTHSHGVEPSLSRRQREEVRQRIADSGVQLVGLGSNERFDSPDAAELKKAIETSKQFVRLSHDVGGTGVKVKPDRFHDGVPRERTIEQIGRALNELGEYGAGFGQQIRLEVHGQCAELPTIKAIMDVAQNENVAICWNSNAQDLQGKGLRYNFDLVRARFGATLHIRELDSSDYPYQQLLDMLVETNYSGWLLLEASSKPQDRVAALARQARLFGQMVAKARG